MLAAEAVDPLQSEMAYRHPVSLFLLAGLIAISAWDSYNLVLNYLYDNRSILVNVEGFNNSFPHLQDQFMRYTVRIGPYSTIYPETWPSAHEWEIAQSQIRHGMEAFIQKIIEKGIPSTKQWLPGDDSEYWTLGDQLNATELMLEISQMDDAAALCTMEKAQSCTGNITQILGRSLPDMRPVLLNKTLLSQLQEAVLYNRTDYLVPVQNLIIGTDASTSNTYRERWPGKPNSSVVHLEFNQIQFDIDLSSVVFPWSKDLHSHYFLVGIGRRLSFDDPSSMHSQPHYQISFSMAGLDTGLFDFPGKGDTDVVGNPSEYTEIAIQIGNVGIFDISQTTECTNVASRYFEYTPKISGNNKPYAVKDWCLHKQYIKAVADNCQCIPYTYRMHAEKLETYYTNNYQNLPFCTTETYLKCPWKEIWTRSQEPCIQPCTTIKNQYSMSTRIVKTEASGGKNEAAQSTCSNDVQDYSLEEFSSDGPIFHSSFGPTPRVCFPAILKLSTSDQVIALYKEQFQQTVYQLVAQIGGDLSLYTGFSFLGLWQFWLITYLTCSFYNRRPKGGKPSRGGCWTATGAISDGLVGVSDPGDKEPEPSPQPSSTTAVTGQADMLVIKQSLDRLERQSAINSKRMDEVVLRLNQHEDVCSSSNRAYFDYQLKGKREVRVSPF